MTPIIIFLSFIIAGLFIAIIIWVTSIYCSMHEHPEPIKDLTNHLHKFNNNHKRGRLIKAEPVGKNKDLLRVLYSARDKDEYGEEKVVYETIIAKKSLTEDTRNEFIIYPRDFTDIDKDELEYNKIKEFITKNNNVDTIIEATQKSMNLFTKVFIESSGGQLQAEINKIMKDFLSKKEPSEEEKEEKKKKE